MTKHLRKFILTGLCCLLLLRLCGCAVVPAIPIEHTSEPIQIASPAPSASPEPLPTPTPMPPVPDIPALGSRYFLSQLSGDELDFCSLIYAGLLELEPKIDLGRTEAIGIEEAQILIQALLDDCPELFMCTGEYTLWGNDHVSSVEFKYRLDRTAYDSCAAEIAALISSWSGSTAGFSDYDKVLFAYDGIASICSYSEDAEMSDTAYGALIGGQALCQGYSKALQLVLQSFGIPCLFVSSLEMVHGWNIACIDGQYYQLDLTWDDSGDMGTYSYLNMSDPLAEKFDHIYDRSPHWVYPECSSLDANYYSTNGLLIPADADVWATFISELDKIYAAGGGRLTLMFSESGQLQELADSQRDWVYEWNRDKYLTVSYTRIIPEHNEYVYIADFCFE